MDDGVDVALERRAEALALLRIRGRLRPGWCGNLASGLADRGIGIVRGHAVTTRVGRWSAAFQVRCSAVGEPSGAEIARLLGAPTRAGFVSPIELDGYHLERSGTRGGCLALAVEGRDRVGFLAALLRRLAYFSLFPVELQLETSGQRVRDRLWLLGAGGREPPLRAEKALGASLDALCLRGEGLGLRER